MNVAQASRLPQARCLRYGFTTQGKDCYSSKFAIYYIASRFEADVAAGRLDALADEALQDLREGRAEWLSSDNVT